MLPKATQQKIITWKLLKKKLKIFLNVNILSKFFYYKFIFTQYKNKKQTLGKIHFKNFSWKNLF